MGRLPRALAAVGLLVVGVWLSAASVNADSHQGAPIPPPDPVQGAFCAGLVLITISADPGSWNATMKVFTARDGTQTLLFTGHQTATVQGNGKSLTFDTSGPGRITFYPDGTTTFEGTGHLLYIGPPGTPQPGIFLYSGTNVIAFTSPTNAIVASYTGSKRDICA